MVSLTHGGMSFGAGTVATQKYGGIIIDAEKHAVGSIKSYTESIPILENPPCNGI